jgi:hypothetical protein
VPGLNNWFCNPTSKAADISTCKPVVYTKSTIKGVIADADPESLTGKFRCGGAAGASTPVAVSPAQSNAVETRAGNPLARDDATPAEIAASEAEAVANAPLSNKTD